MEIKYGDGKSEFGPGVSVELTGDEVAVAIDAWLVANRVYISGPRTILVNECLCETGRVYVDPSGSVIAAGDEFSGRGRGMGK